MNYALSILANTTVENPGIADALPYLVGFLVVLVTLAVLMGLCMLIGVILKNFETAPAAQPVVKRAPAVTKDDSIPPEVVAVIAAAVSTVAGSRRIMSIKPRQSSWGQSGRQRVQSSHNIRKH